MSRFSSVLVAAVLALALAASPARAQVATASATDFVGAWNIALQGDMALTLALTVTDQEGQLAASVVTMGTTDRVRTITRSESALVFAYETDFQGQAVPITITLLPTDDGVRATLNAAGGAFTISGTATKG